MSADKYVEDIVSKIKCTTAKKKEIRTQLLSDISMRIEQGESLEQIVESMGTAQEIADAFMQDLPEAEKKSYRKKTIGVIIGSVVAGLLLMVCYIWWALPKTVDIDGLKLCSEEELTARVAEVVELLDRDDFEALRETSIVEMRQLLTPETIDQVRGTISDDWGGRQTIGTVYTQGMKQKGKLLIVTQTDVIYDNVNVVYTITFDADLKLAGFYMR